MNKCVYVIFAMFVSCNFFSIKNARIIKLTMLTDSGYISDRRNSKYRFDYYMVENYHSKADIYEYVTKHLDSSFLKLNQYDMIFYEKSSDVNIENIMSYPPDLRYKTVLYQKPLATYTWFNGHLCTSCPNN